MARVKSPVVLVAPLDWGLGHATRCISIIHGLRARGCRVIVATSGGALTLLREEFPDVQSFELPAYRAHYSKVFPLVIALLFQLPRFLNAIAREHRQLAALVRSEGVQLIISDNRYGAWSKNVRGIFITHQVKIILPAYLQWASFLVDHFHSRQIRKFDECWVPDWPDRRLTKVLSHTNQLPLVFIGPLSRFTLPEQDVEKIYDVLAIISGPETQRSELELLLTQQLESSGLRFLMVLGKPGSTSNVRPSQVNHLGTKELLIAIKQSKLVIARSGYSTVMDLIALRSKVVFIPTPGQTEQEFLAEDLERQQVAYYESQQNFNLNRALQRSKNYSGFATWQMQPNLLAAVLDSTVQKIR